MFPLKNWELTNSIDSIKLNVEVPGEVHDYLFKAKLLPNPILYTNENLVQWVATQTWKFSTQFHITTYDLEQPYHILQLNKVDGIAQIVINQQNCFISQNSFIQNTVLLNGYLKEGNNTLEIILLPIEDWIKTKSTQLPYVLSHENRVFVRKPQYQFGWDWGPKIIGIGIYDVPFIRFSDSMNIEKTQAPTLPWARLEQQKDSVGQSFLFVDNKTNVPIFIKGANWIPPSSLYPVSCENYEKLISMASSVGINMLRVWGGGHYESDCFYEICKKYGILVWQDFMFACAMYPGDEGFINEIKIEVEQQVKRLSQYENVVLFCGNNEVDEGWKNWGWQKQYNYSPTDSEVVYHHYRKIFNEAIPEIVEKLGHTRNYVHTSPLHGWGRKESMTHGDSHYWGVWWGLESIDKYKEKVPRFMSEYGMQSLPHPTTILEMNEGKMPTDTTSATMRLHQKHPYGYKYISHYISDYYDVSDSLLLYIYQSQLIQAFALKTAIEAQRKSMPYCMGTLYWQFNDCWPVTSWSTVDYYGKWKAAMYALKELNAPILVVADYQNESIFIHILSDKIKAGQGKLKIELIDFQTSEVKISQIIPYNLSPTSGKAMATIPTDELKKSGFHKSHYLLKTTVTTAENESYTRNHYFTKPSELNLDTPKFSIQKMGDAYYISADKFAKNVWIQEIDAYGENFFDLIPGEIKKLPLLKREIDVNQIVSENMISK